MSDTSNLKNIMLKNFSVKKYQQYSDKKFSVKRVLKMLLKILVLKIFKSVFKQKLG